MNTVLESSKNIECKNCYRKLCKVIVKNDVKLLEHKHKGSRVLAAQAMIQCVGCKTMWLVTAETSDIVETNIE